VSQPTGASGATPYGQPGTGYVQGGGSTSYSAPTTTEDYGYGTDAQPMTEEGHPDVENVSVGQLIGEVSRDMSTLMRQELELAKAEMKVEAKKAGQGAGMFGAAGFAGYMVLMFLSFALWWALGYWFDNLAWAALVVAVIWGIVAAVLALRGKKEMKEVQGLPKTADTVKKIPDAVKGNEEANR